jgi:hypothetical protein
MEKRAATVLEELAIEISQLRSQIRAQAAVVHISPNDVICV